jgi:hypothetical protein
LGVFEFVVEWFDLFGVLAEYLFVFGWVAKWVVVVWVLAESDGLLSPCSSLCLGVRGTRVMVLLSFTMVYLFLTPS